MTQQPDKLFREKLEGFQVNTPSAAWSRVESRLYSSSRKYFWMKIAAGILLLVFAGSLVMFSLNPERTSVAVTSQEDSKQPHALMYKPVEKTQNPPISTPPVLMPELKSGSITMPVTKEIKNNSFIALTKLIEENNLNTDMASTPSTEIPSSASVETIATNTTAQLSENTAEAGSHVYLVYTAKEVNAKYLKKSTPIDTNSLGKKTSAIEKLLGIASNVKNGEHGLGDLREMKDEFLTFTFLDDKKNNN